MYTKHQSGKKCLCVCVSVRVYVCVCSGRLAMQTRGSEGGLSIFNILDLWRKISKTDAWISSEYIRVLTGLADEPAGTCCWPSAVSLLRQSARFFFLINFYFLWLSLSKQHSFCISCSGAQSWGKMCLRKRYRDGEINVHGVGWVYQLSLQE